MKVKERESGKEYVRNDKEKGERMSGKMWKGGSKSYCSYVAGRLN